MIMDIPMNNVILLTLFFSGSYLALYITMLFRAGFQKKRMETALLCFSPEYVGEIIKCPNFIMLPVGYKLELKFEGGSVGIEDFKKFPYGDAPHQYMYSMTSVFFKLEHNYPLKVYKRDTLHSLGAVFSLFKEMDVGEADIDKEFFIRKSDKVPTPSIINIEKFLQLLRLSHADSKFMALFFYDQALAETKVKLAYEARWVAKNGSGILYRQRGVLDYPMRLKEILDQLVPILKELFKEEHLKNQNF